MCSVWEEFLFLFLLARVSAGMENIKYNYGFRSYFINDLLTPDGFESDITRFIFKKRICDILVGHKTQTFCQIPDFIPYKYRLINRFFVFDVIVNPSQ